MLKRKIASLLMAAAGLLLTTWGAIALQTRKVDEKSLKNAGKTGDEWLTVGLNYAEQRYSPLKQIDTTNVGRLSLAWSYELGEGGGQQEATPLVIDGDRKSTRLNSSHVRISYAVFC